MTKMPTVLALDIAKSMGWSFGTINSAPMTGTVELSGDCIFSRGDFLSDWVVDFIRVSQPNVIAIEVNIVGALLVRGRSNINVARSVFNLEGNACGKAVRVFGYKVFQSPTAAMTYPDKSILFIGAQAARKHFVGKPKFAVTDDGKRASLLKAREMGWTVNSLDAADAAAVWDTACCYVAPSVYARGRSAQFTGRLSRDFRPSIGKHDRRQKSDGPLFAGA